MPDRITHFDLFTGIGGFALAAAYLGIRTIGFSEIDPFCCRLLEQRFSGIPNYGDIRKIDGSRFNGTTIVTGGYPCQPFSTSGYQRAEKDDRHLWPPMREFIAQAQPDWVICENVYGHIRLGLDDVLADLDSLGYTPQPFVIPSLARGANHRRDRVYIVAHAPSDGQHEGQIRGSGGQDYERPTQRPDQAMQYERCSDLGTGMEWDPTAIRGRGIEPPALRVDDGLPHRMDRIKAIGNAVDPYVAYRLLQAVIAS